MTARQFRKERKAENAKAKKLAARYMDKINKHRSNYIDIWLHRISQDKEIPANAKWAWWSITVDKAKEIILMPSVGKVEGRKITMMVR